MIRDQLFAGAHYATLESVGIAHAFAAAMAVRYARENFSERERASLLIIPWMSAKNLHGPPLRPTSPS